MLGCKDVADRTSALVDGKLGLVDSLHVRLHLARCRGCRTFVRQMTVTDRLAQTAISAGECDTDAQIEAILARAGLHDVVQRPIARRAFRIPRHVPSGMTAGLIATIILSALMVLNAALDIMPQPDFVALIAGAMGASVAIGWVVHFMIGALAWGGGFALVQAHLPGGAVTRGVVFGIFAWLAMMILVMPMAGAGMFGAMLGLMAPLTALGLHVIFGAVLGASFRHLTA